MLYDCELLTVYSPMIQKQIRWSALSSEKITAGNSCFQVSRMEM